MKSLSKYIDMSIDELQSAEKELREELFNLRFQQATGQIQNPLDIRNTRRDIARVKTLLRQHEIKSAKA